MKYYTFTTFDKSTVYVFIFVDVNFHGFRGHLVICENNLCKSIKKILLGESTKISAVQLQPFLHNDPFLLKCHLVAYHMMMVLFKYVLFLYLSSLKQQKDQKIVFSSLPYLLILVIKLIITPNSGINKAVCTLFITTKNNTHENKYP